MKTHNLLFDICQKGRLGNGYLKVINIDYIISGAAREVDRVRARGRGGALDRLRTDFIEGLCPGRQNE